MSTYTNYNIFRIKAPILLDGISMNSLRIRILNVIRRKVIFRSINKKNLNFASSYTGILFNVFDLVWIPSHSKGVFEKIRRGSQLKIRGGVIRAYHPSVHHYDLFKLYTVNAGTYCDKTQVNVKVAIKIISKQKCFDREMKILKALELFIVDPKRLFEMFKFTFRPFVFVIA